MRKKTKRKVWGLHPLQRQAYYSEFSTKMTKFITRAYMMDDGEDAADLLSPLFVVIGSVCQAGATQFGSVQFVEELRGALETIGEMCNDGYKWRKSEARYLHDACLLAEEKLVELKPDAFARGYIDAESVAFEIMEKKWRTDSIVSA